MPQPQAFLMLWQPDAQEPIGQAALCTMLTVDVLSKDVQ